MLTFSFPNVMRTQLDTRASVKNIDNMSAGISFVSSGIGGLVGNVSSKLFQMPTFVIGNSLDYLSKFNVFSKNIISNIVGGLSGSLMDLGLQERYLEFKDSQKFSQSSFLMNSYNNKFNTSL